MEILRLYPLNKSPTAVENFCAAMPHMTKLDLCYGHTKCKYARVLRAIAANMHHLKSLSISSCKVDPKAIEYLLPTEDNDLGGCPELVELDLWHIKDVGVELLKKIILALPKLRSLRHELLVDALGALTEEEMGVDTARYLNTLCAHPVYGMQHLSSMQYGILVQSAVFQRLNKNIITVDIRATSDAIGS